jgi:hypothetical protein
LNDANLIKQKTKKAKTKNKFQIISRKISGSTTKTDLIYRLILNKTITLERKNNRAHRHRSKEFLGLKILILIQLRNIIQNLLPEEPL